MSLDPEFEKKIYRLSSIPLPDGGETHIHLFGHKKDDFTITTFVPPKKIHDLGSRQTTLPKFGIGG